jgi:hypothetical protein
MKNMDLPGFTAEAALGKLSARFQARTEADVSGGLVHPAGGMYYIPTPVYCLSKLVCRPINRFPWIQCSNTGFGIWNPVTNRCE